MSSFSFFSLSFRITWMNSVNYLFFRFSKKLPLITSFISAYTRPNFSFSVQYRVCHSSALNISHSLLLLSPLQALLIEGGAVFILLLQIAPQ